MKEEEETGKRQRRARTRHFDDCVFRCFCCSSTEVSAKFILYFCLTFFFVCRESQGRLDFLFIFILLHHHHRRRRLHRRMLSVSFFSMTTLIIYSSDVLAELIILTTTYYTHVTEYNVCARAHPCIIFTGRTEVN